MSVELGRRIGYRTAQRLMAMLREEERHEALGLREPNQPSQARTDLERAVMRSEFTPAERHRMRVAAGFDPAEELDKLIADRSTSGSESRDG